jgi:AcrR family transcriptional regulator
MTSDPKRAPVGRPNPGTRASADRPTPAGRASVGRPASAEADLLAAAERLLVRGARFTDLSAQQIATEAGVARSSFYVHFKDKSDLLIRLAGQLTVSNFDTASTWRPADGVEVLAEAFAKIVTAFREHAAVRRAVAEAAAYDESVRAFWARELDQFSTWTAHLLQLEQAAGRTPPDLDLDSATAVIVLGGERAIVNHVNTHDATTDRAFATELARIWWHGAYRRTPDPHD